MLPLDDRTAGRAARIERPQSEPPRTRYIYYPDTAPVPEGVAVNVRGRSYKIIADVDITDGRARGDLRARLALRRPRLFIKDRKLYYVYNFLGIKPEQNFVSRRTCARQTRARHGVHTREAGEHGESIGKTQLYVDDKVVAEGADADAERASSPCAATACASASTAATTSARSTTPRTRSPTGRSSASRST